VEICAKSGLLATDKCYDTVKNDAARNSAATYHLSRTGDGDTDAKRINATCMAMRAVALCATCRKAEGPARRWRGHCATSFGGREGTDLIAENDPYNAVRSNGETESGSCHHREI